MPRHKCPPGCTCGLHRQRTLTQQHKDRIREGVKRAQRDNRRAGKPINQRPVRCQSDTDERTA